MVYDVYDSLFHNSYDSVLWSDLTGDASAVGIDNQAMIFSKTPPTPYDCNELCIGSSIYNSGINLHFFN